jgi:hypothetical protein
MGEPALPVFPMQPVKSSNIAKLGWRDGELRVEFSNGGLFSYAGVDNATYRQLIAASSLGKHFGKYIRPKFKGTKL